MRHKHLARPLLALILLIVAMALAAGSVGAVVRSDEGLQECDPPLGAPTLTYPANGATVGPAGIVLQWTAVDGAESYTGQLSDDSSFPADKTLEESGVTATSYALPELSSGICLYWRVKAVAACGDGPWSSTRRFCSPQPTDTPVPPTDTPVPPTDTPTVGPTNTPTDTPTKTKTPTPSKTPDGRYFFGYVRDVATEEGLAGVTVSLYRNESGSWSLISQKTTDSSGNYAFGFSPVPSLHRIIETDPYDYSSDRVALPSGFDGTAVNANTVEFQPPAAGSVGPIVFYDRRLPTATATNTPTHTPSPTATEEATLTPTPTLSPTEPGEIYRVWLPMALKAFVR